MEDLGTLGNPEENILNKIKIEDAENINYYPHENSVKENKLKKYRTAYIIFCTEIRSKLKKAEIEESEFYSKNLKEKFVTLFVEHKKENFNNNVIIRKIAEIWAKCSYEDKKEFYDREKKEKEIFENKKQLGLDYKYSKSQRFKKPIRFRTPYMFFIKEHKQNLQNKDKLENIKYIRNISVTWKKMSNEEKQKFISLAQEDKKRYHNEYFNYMRNIFSQSARNKKKNPKKIELIKKFLNKIKKIYKNKKSKTGENINDNTHSDLNEYDSSINPNQNKNDTIAYKDECDMPDKIDAQEEKENVFLPLNKIQFKSKIMKKFVKENLEEQNNPQNENEFQERKNISNHPYCYNKFKDLLKNNLTNDIQETELLKKKRSYNNLRKEHVFRIDKEKSRKNSTMSNIENLQVANNGEKLNNDSNNIKEEDNLLYANAGSLNNENSIFINNENKSNSQTKTLEKIGGMFNPSIYKSTSLKSGGTDSSCYINYNMINNNFLGSGNNNSRKKFKLDNFEGIDLSDNYKNNDLDHDNYKKFKNFTSLYSRNNNNLKIDDVHLLNPNHTESPNKSKKNSKSIKILKIESSSYTSESSIDDSD